MAGVPGPAVDASTPMTQAYYRDFRDCPPDSVSELGSKTWITRGQNCLVAWTDAVATDSLSLRGQVDEYAVLTFDASAPIRIVTPEAEAEIREGAFSVVPPGDSEIQVLDDGPVVRVLSTRGTELTPQADNASCYLEADPRCAPLEPWPDPVGGFTLRVYRLAETPVSPDRFGRIFRTTNLMVNFLPEEAEPRDPQKLSPHHHDDFQQLSLAVRGKFVHHIRYPWGPRSDLWREDEHLTADAPSIAVIPPPAVHTTQGIGDYQQLIDIFSPPRDDFSAQPGWVLNAEDYPRP